MKTLKLKRNTFNTYAIYFSSSAKAFLTLIYKFLPQCSYYIRKPWVLYTID